MRLCGRSRRPVLKSTPPPSHTLPTSITRRAWQAINAYYGAHLFGRATGDRKVSRYETMVFVVICSDTDVCMCIHHHDASTPSNTPLHPPIPPHKPAREVRQAAPGHGDPLHAKVLAHAQRHHHVRPRLRGQQDGRRRGGLGRHLPHVVRGEVRVCGACRGCMRTFYFGWVGGWGKGRCGCSIGWPR